MSLSGEAIKEVENLLQAGRKTEANPGSFLFAKKAA